MKEYIITEESLHQIGFDIEREIFDEILSHPLSEHDVEIAKKERVRVLDELREWVEWVSVLIPDNVDEKIESMRGEP